jgi:hypothetical protein
MTSRAVPTTVTATLVGTALAALAAVLVPPWAFTQRFDGVQGYTRPAGHRFLFDPPTVGECLAAYAEGEADLAALDASADELDPSAFKYASAEAQTTALSDPREARLLRGAVVAADTIETTVHIDHWRLAGHWGAVVYAAGLVLVVRGVVIDRLRRRPGARDAPASGGQTADE